MDTSTTTTTSEFSESETERERDGDDDVTVEEVAVLPPAGPPPPKKKKKRSCKYRAEWEADANFKWLESVRGDPFKANCTVCRRQFTVSHGGLSDVRQHAAGENHKRYEKQKRSQGALAQFLVPQATPETNKVC